VSIIDGTFMEITAAERSLLDT